MSARSVLFAGATFALSVSLCDAAHAYCRTTTCNPKASCSLAPDECCRRDEHGCDTAMPPLSWPTSCVSYSIHEDGSEKYDISAETLSRVVDGAFDQWMSADCESGSLSLAVESRGLSSCGAPEYTGATGKNANVWMFRDSGPLANGSEPTAGGMNLDASALALSTVNFNYKTAEIYDVDVELNSALAEFTTSDSEVMVDLASVVTHEAGHFLGLDHSLETDSVMREVYNPGSIAQRTVGADDEAGVCAIYDEDRSFPGGKTCDPRGGYTDTCYTDQGCGCRVVGTSTERSRSSAPVALLSLLGAAWALRRRTRIAVARAN